MQPAERVPVSGLKAFWAPRDGGKRFHHGVDLLTAGRVVVAPEAGIISAVVRQAPTPKEQKEGKRLPPWSGYGPGVVELLGKSGAWHVLAHVHPISELHIGDQVKEGQTLANGSDLAHVHWEVREARGVKAPVMDPGAWLRGVKVPPHTSGQPPGPTSPVGGPSAGSGDSDGC